MDLCSIRVAEVEESAKLAAFAIRADCADFTNENAQTGVCSDFTKRRKGGQRNNPAIGLNVADGVKEFSCCVN
jgi:hypothetical protein